MTQQGSSRRRYQLGRSSPLEKTQEDAPRRKAEVVRRYMAAAMATPGICWGVYAGREVGHFPKLRRISTLRPRRDAGHLREHGIAPPHSTLFGRESSHSGSTTSNVNSDEFDSTRLSTFPRNNEATEASGWPASSKCALQMHWHKKGILYLDEARALLKSGRDSTAGLLHRRSYNLPSHLPRSSRVCGSGLRGQLARSNSARTNNRHHAEGGSQGRLIVFDWREHWGTQPDKKPI